MLNPWIAPLMMSSASVIAMRTWMLMPAGGRQTDWQRRETARMIGEKVDAVRESQAEVMAFAWQMCFAPWSVLGASPVDGLHKAFSAATDSALAPFSRRAAANAKRLQARAMVPMFAAMPMLAAPAAMTAAAPVRKKRAAR